uniref:uncharacterized protein n=1 Tax=Lonchura striata TaxID=40157 RepID=UPI0012936951|nr:uncharacterized protein LOC116184798 [Lonchura striata domestica]
MQACTNVGQNQLMPRSCFLPVPEDDSHVQQLSMFVFRTLLSAVAEEGKKLLMTQVCQSLLPLFFHCHEENQCVAEVRTRGLLLSPWEGARLPPALAPGRLHPPPGPGTGMLILSPGLWGHFRISIALQASQETLLCVAKFLNRRDLEKSVKKEKLWRFIEILVRRAGKPQPQPGAAPERGARCAGWQLCPCPLLQPEAARALLQAVMSV